MEYRINLTDDTAEQLGRVLGEPIQELEQEILDKEQEIAEKEQEIEELEAEIEAFPAIESKNITANGTYSEEGKAYSPVVVNVPQTTVQALNVTQNGTYSESGKAYSPVTVNVPQGAVLKTVTLKVLNSCGEPVYFGVPYYSSGVHRWQNACRLVASGGEAQTLSMTIIDNGDIDNINFTMFCINGSAVASLGSPTSSGFSDITTTHASSFMNVNVKVDYTKSTDSLTISIA